MREIPGQTERLRVAPVDGLRAVLPDAVPSEAAVGVLCPFVPCLRPVRVMSSSRVPSPCQARLEGLRFYFEMTLGLIHLTVVLKSNNLKRSESSTEAQKQTRSTKNASLTNVNIRKVLF